MKDHCPHDWLFAHAEHTPDASALDGPDQRVTYRQLAGRTLAFAHALAQHGMARGERVLIALPNSPAAVVAGLGVQAAGGCSAEVSPTVGSAALARIAGQVAARLAVISAAELRTWAAIAAAQRFEHLWIVGAERASAEDLALLEGLCWEPMDADGKLATAPEAAEALVGEPRGIEEPALILFTSGSTAAPRGVVLTFGNLDANARAIVAYLGLDHRDRAMLILPLSYAYGRSVLHTHLLVGGSLFLDTRFMYPRLVLEAIAEERCTGFAGVPASFEIVRRQLGSHLPAMPSLRYVTQAGGAMSPTTIRWCREVFAPARLFVMYGQTEATARLTYLPPEQLEAKPGSIGVPVAGVEIRIVDEAGRELAPGAVGELVARGPNIALGYLEAPEESRAVFRDGWLWTGDLAYRDEEGFLFVVGRSKEILKIGGQRVSPSQIEEAIAAHPEVAEVAVAAIADPVGGESAGAWVVARPGSMLNEALLRRFCRESLPAALVPRQVVFVDALPRGASGKVLRRELEKLSPRVGTDRGAA